MTDTVLKYRNKSCRIFREIFFLRASRIHPMQQSGLLKNMFLTARLRNNILKKSSIHKVKSLMNTRYGTGNRTWTCTLSHQNLNLACLPIPPYPYIKTTLKNSASCGGKRGIRTLERVLAVTRFPIVRLRPAQPSFHDFNILSYPRRIVKNFFEMFSYSFMRWL